MTRWMAAIVVAAVALAGCGDDGSTEDVMIPEKVDTSLAPAALSGGALSLREDNDATKAFGRLPDNALVADGRLYAIRDGDRLVATLQMSTLVPEVDLTEPGRYQEIADKLLPGVKSELSVADVPVFEFATEDKTVYVWFGRQMFQVLQLKGLGVEPEKVLAELIDHQLAQKAWEPLPEEVTDA